MKKNNLKNKSDLMKMSGFSQEAQKVLFFLYLNDKYNTRLMLQDTEGQQIALNTRELILVEEVMRLSDIPEALFVLGFIYAKFGDYKLGLNYLERAKAKNYPLAHIVLAYFKLSEVQHYFKHPENKDITEWMRGLKEAHHLLTDMERKNITVWSFDMLMGIVLHGLKHYEQAIRRFQSAIQKNEFKGKANATIGVINEEIEHKDELAKERYLKALQEGIYEITPRLTRIHIKRGEYQPALNLLEEMATHWGKYDTLTTLKSTFWLSYMLGKLQKPYMDLTQSYMWTKMGTKIYLLHGVENKTFDRKTESYVLPDVKIGQVQLSISTFPEIDESYWPRIMDLKKEENQIKQEHVKVLSDIMNQLEQNMRIYDVRQADERAKKLFDLLYSVKGRNSCNNVFH